MKTPSALLLLFLALLCAIAVEAGVSEPDQATLRADPLAFTVTDVAAAYAWAR